MTYFSLPADLQHFFPGCTEVLIDVRLLSPLEENRRYSHNHSDNSNLLPSC